MIYEEKRERKSILFEWNMDKFGWRRVETSRCPIFRPEFLHPQPVDHPLLFCSKGQRRGPGDIIPSQQDFPRPLSFNGPAVSEIY